MWLPLLRVLQWLPTCQGDSGGALGCSAGLLLQSPVLPSKPGVLPLALVCQHLHLLWLTQDSSGWPCCFISCSCICVSRPETISAIPPLEAPSSFLLEYYLLCAVFCDRASRQGRNGLFSCSHTASRAPRLEEAIFPCCDWSASLPPSLVSEQLGSTDCVLLVLITSVPGIVRDTELRVTQQLLSKWMNPHLFLGF